MTELVFGLEIFKMYIIHNFWQISIFLKDSTAFVYGLHTLHWKYQLGKWNELSMPLTWGHSRPIQGSFLPIGKKNNPNDPRWVSGIG